MRVAVPHTPNCGTSGEQPLLKQRAALMLIAAVLIGVGADILASLADTKPAHAVLVSGAAFTAAITPLNALPG